MKKLLFLTGVFFISGCTMPPELVVMQNPKTQEVAQCKHDAWGTINREDVQECVDGYTKAGWVRLSRMGDFE
jgi:hypothetical protein